MKIINCIKLGCGIYIGWTIAESIDSALGKTKVGKKIWATADKLWNEAYPEKHEETVVMGFRA